VAQDWVEFRIHGVSGTPPEELLGDPHVVQVAGDGSRRIFQRADHVGDPLPRDSDGRLLEGYHWGNLTSGSWRQALWLLLIPFGVINAAQFMLPPTAPIGSVSGSARLESATRLERWRTIAGHRTALISHTACGALLRLIGLAQTCVLAFSSTFIFMELVGRKWAAHLTDEKVTRTAIQIDESTALRAGLIVSLLSVLFLFTAGGRIRRLELRHGEPDAEHWQSSGLRRWSFFAGDSSASDLRRLHLAAGTMVTIILGSYVGSTERLRLVAIGVLGLTAVIVALIGDPEGSASLDLAEESILFDVREKVRLVAKGASILFVGIGFVLAVVLLFSHWQSKPVSELIGESVDAPGQSLWAEILLATNVSLVIVLIVVNGVLSMTTREPIRDRRLRRRFGRYVKGNAAGLLTAVAVYLGLGFSAAFTYAAARVTGVDDNDFPPMVQRTAYAWGITVIVIALVALIAIVSWLFSAGMVIEPKPGDPDKPPLMGLRKWRSGFEWRPVFRRRARINFSDGRGGMTVPGEWEGRIATAMWKAWLKTQLPALVILFTITGTTMSIVAGYEEFNPRHLWWQPDSLEGHALPKMMQQLSATADDGTWLTWLGTFTLLLLAAQLAALGRGAISKQSKRRGTSVVWDVIAFWPHSAHPFAPPPYSQVVVQHFRDRIRWHLYGGTLEGQPDPSRPDRHVVPSQRVVVAAHSQGSLIALAALLWLSDEEREWVGFLTYGSQLQVAFPRGFPDYVNYQLLVDVRHRLSRRWVNLYRETDPIAGPVLSWGHWEDEPDDPHDMRSYSFVHPGDAADEAPGVDRISPLSARRVCGGEGDEERGGDWRLLDPTPADPHAQTRAVTRIRAHSNYFADPDYLTAVRAVLPN
jgi:hypothetical protein